MNQHTSFKRPELLDMVSVLDNVDAQDAGGASAAGDASLRDRAIGEIIRDTKDLSPQQIEQILELQKERGLKFGEAAVALGYARDEDVVWALSQQFHYPYAPEATEQLNSELVVASQPFGRTAEAFRALRSQLMMRLFSGRDPRRRALAVVSPDRGDGKTFFAANIAVAFSQLGGRTLLIDADMRQPRQHELFGIDNTSGLSSILGGRSEANVIRPAAHLPSLFVLPVGVAPPNPIELVERPAFQLLLRELLGKFDHVVVDTPAAEHGADASAVAAKCGAAVVIARKGRSNLHALNNFVGLLRESPVTLAGLVMNEF